MRVNSIVSCHPAKDRDPYEDEIAACKHWLEADLLEVQPTFIIALGRIACQWFAGSDFELALEHGRARELPCEWNKEKSFILLPSYHPAAAMREGGRIDMRTIANDFKEFKKVIFSGIMPIADSVGADYAVGY